jgi:hypothetical protein
VLTPSPFAPVTTQIQDILERKKRLQLMYDADLIVSELYFFMSQALRFARLWIRESCDDLRGLVQHLEKEHFSVEGKQSNPHASFLPDRPEAQQAAIQVFKQNWAAVMDHQTKLADGLFDRIGKKESEINSLSDAVSANFFEAEVL